MSPPPPPFPAFLTAKKIKFELNTPTKETSNAPGGMRTSLSDDSIDDETLFNITDTVLNDVTP